MKLVGPTLVAALSGRLLAEAGSVVQTKEITGEFLLGLNLGRTARLNTRVALLGVDKELEKKASDKLKTDFPDNENCSSAPSATLTPVKMEGFYLTSKNYEGDVSSATSVVQTVLNAALEELENYTQEGVGTVFDSSLEPFSHESVQNAAYIMFPPSTKVGCAQTTDCTDDSEKQFLLCYFTPTLEDATSSTPFPTDLYNSMVARQKAGIQLTQLGPDGLETPLTPPSPPQDGGDGGVGAEGAASYGLPGAGLLLFTVMGMLAF
ncbi:hypothetical protein Emed_003294 [Eimeria media]